MRIARDGGWFHLGEPIRRPGLVRLFSTMLRKDDEGFMLVTPAEKLSIVVEDAPFLAVLMAAEGEGEDQTPHFTTNVGDERDGRPGSCLAVFARSAKRRAGSLSACAPRRLEAKLARPVYYHLVERAVERREDLGVWSGGGFFHVLGRGCRERYFWRASGTIRWRRCAACCWTSPSREIGHDDYDLHPELRPPAQTAAVEAAVLLPIIMRAGAHASCSPSAPRIWRAIAGR